MTSKLLITGVPGTGKTTVACYLEQHHGYAHIDMEERGFRPAYEFSQDSKRFLAAIHGEKVVVSWGFGPFANRRSVEQFIDDGYRPVWLDGDRVASFREFMRREGADLVMEYKYYGQMQMIVATDIVERLRPAVINPFDADGLFRPVAEIVGDILQAAR